MTEQDILVQEGMNLLYSGMGVVFSFLMLLIILVNLLRMFLAFIPQKSNVSSGDIESPIPVANKIHHRIIKEVLTGIRS